MILNELFSGKNNMKTCYVNRPVLNKEAVRDWARANGFRSTLPGEDFHVTLVYSKKPFDWSKVSPDQNVLYIEPDTRRELHVFDGGATVVHFKDERLDQRWADIIKMGAGTSYPTYKAHVTITYKGKPARAIAYPGELILGPENWQEINDDWRDGMAEVPLG